MDVPGAGVDVSGPVCMYVYLTLFFLPYTFLIKEELF